jgi:prolipoprotein diacylglyceryl transferase
MVSDTPGTPLAFLPSPPVNGFHIGPLFLHFYGLMYVVGIALAIYITRRRWRALGGNPALVADVATWAVPAGIIGGRIYFDITTPADIPHHWWGVFAVWSGGLGIWGGVALGAAAGIWRVRRTGASAGLFGNAVAPALLVAQAVGRVGNYFNQELFGKPSTLPWALQIDPAHRPAGFTQFATFQPTFLYELIWDLALAAALVWLGHHRRIRPWGLFALYVAGYSAFRIVEESLRIDSSEHFLGLRLNFYVAVIGTVAGLAWFWSVQRRPAPDDERALAAGRADDAAADAAGAGPAETAGPPEPDGAELDGAVADDAEAGSAAAGTAGADHPAGAAAADDAASGAVSAPRTEK